MADNPLFLQVHFFYPAYVASFFDQRPNLIAQGSQAITRAMLADGFAGTHLVGPYMEQNGYRSELIIANCAQAQERWLQEHGMAAADFDSPLAILARQINMLRP